MPTPIRLKHVSKSKPNSSVSKSLPALEPFSLFFLPPPASCSSSLAPTSPILSSRAPSAVRASSPSARLWVRALAHCAALCWRHSRRNQRTAAPRRACPLRLPLLRPRSRPHRRLQHALGRRVTRRLRCCTPRLCPTSSDCQCLANSRPHQRRSPHHRQHESPPAHLCRHANRGLLHAPRWRQHAAKNASRDTGGADRPRHASRPCRQCPRCFLRQNS